MSNKSIQFSFLNHWPIHRKLKFSVNIALAGYALVILFTMIMGLVIVQRLSFVANTYDVTQQALTIFEQQQSLYQNAVMMGEADLVQQAAAKDKPFLDALNKVKQYNLLHHLNLSASQQESWIKSFTAFQQKSFSIYDRMSKNDTDPSLADLATALAVEKEKLNKDLKQLNELHSHQLKKSLMNISFFMMGELLLIFVLFILTTSTTVYISRSVSRRLFVEPIRQLGEVAASIAKGNLSASVTIEQQDELGELARQFTEMVDSLKDKSQAAEQIAVGNLMVNFSPASDADTLGHSMLSMIDSLKKVVSDIGVLSDSALTGNLSHRIDLSAHRGDYARIVEGINQTLDAVLGPVHEASHILQLLADSDLSVVMSGNYSGDHALIKNRLNAAINQLKISMGQVGDSASSVNTSSSQILEGSQLVVNNTKGQIQSIQKVLDSIREVSSAATNNESAAKRVQELTQKAITGSEEIVKSVQELTIAMNEIKESSANTQTVIESINDIASKTRLLSLNATIEAARAGEAGRGFAVVASEVKSLAQGSRQSAQNIGELITGLQKKSQDAANAMANAGIAVKEGNAALADTLRIFNELTGSVEDISKKMVTVAGATETQAASFEVITASVNEMSGLVRQTAKDALNSSTTSEEALSVVHNITQVIKEINGAIATINTEMGKFKLKS